MLDMILNLSTASLVNDFFNAADQSGLATFIKNSPTIIPWAGAFHLLSLGLMGGAVILADLRNIGPGLTSPSAKELNRSMNPWLIAALIVLVLSGTVLALGEMTRLLYSPPYWMKMAALASALVFTFGVRNSVINNDGKFSPVAIVLSVLALTLYLISFVILSSWLARIAFLVMVLILGALYMTAGKRSSAVPAGIRAVSAITIALWFTTALAGRWIAFW